MKVEFIKCHHGREKRFGKCPECAKEQQSLNQLALNRKYDIPTKIPIKRGCQAQGGCFCDGSCKEIIGHRDPLFPGEKP